MNLSELFQIKTLNIYQRGNCLWRQEYATTGHVRNNKSQMKSKRLDSPHMPRDISVEPRRDAAQDSPRVTGLDFIPVKRGGTALHSKQIFLLVSILHMTHHK